MAASTTAVTIIILVVFLPTQLVKLDLGGRPEKDLSVPELLKAKNDVRGTLIQTVAGGFVLAGLYFTYQTVQVNREGQITERFTRAIDQLGSDKLDVRLGGVYALERIAKDSKADHGPVMEVLTAFLREHSVPSGEADEGSGDLDPEGAESVRARADLQAAARVIGGRNTQNDLPGVRLYLSRVALPRANLERGNFRGTRLRYADFRYADLEGANFRDANLRGANFEGAKLIATDFRGADLTGALLEGARGSRKTLWPAGFSPAAAGVVMEVEDVEGPA